MNKLIVKLCIFFFLAFIFIIVGVDISFAEQIADHKVDEVIPAETPDDPKAKKAKDPNIVDKTLKFVWDHKYYILIGIACVFAGYIVYSAMPGAELPKESNGNEVPSPNQEPPKAALIDPDIVRFAELKDTRYGINLKAFDKFPIRINADITRAFNQDLIIKPYHNDVQMFDVINWIKTQDGRAFNVLYTGSIMPYTDTLTPHFWITRSGLDANAALFQTHFYAEVKLIEEGTFNVMPYHQVAVVQHQCHDGIPSVELKAAVFMRDKLEKTDILHITESIHREIVEVEYLPTENTSRELALSEVPKKAPSI